MITAGTPKYVYSLSKKIFLASGSIFLFLLINNCSNIQENIYYIQDSTSSYQYIFNKHGILKARHNPNQLILFDSCLKKIQMMDNISYNYPYEIAGWKNDTIELCLLLNDSDWDFYIQKYYRIRNYNSFIGKYFIRYSHKPIMQWNTVKDTIDSIRINVGDFSLHMANKGIIKDTCTISNLWFNDRILEYKSDDGRTGLSKKIHLTNGLTNKNILDKMIAIYTQTYCK